MSQNIRDVAFLVECAGCTEGKLLPGTKLEMDCIKCNGHGVFIQKTTLQEMQKFLAKKQADE